MKSLPLPPQNSRPRMIPTSLQSIDPHQPASTFPRQVADSFIVDLVGELSMADDPEEGAVAQNLRRHAFYELRQVRLEDVCYRGEGYHESLVKDYRQMPADSAPPIVLDGVMMTPWDGFHRLNAARERGDETIWAYVGIRPRPDRKVFHDFPSLQKSWETAGQLHRLLAALVIQRNRYTPGQPYPSSTPEELKALVKDATPEYMDELGASLLGVAVEAWQKAPPSLSDSLQEIVQDLMKRGASPDRSFKRVEDQSPTTPFHLLMGQYHPAPTLLTPEDALPPDLWAMMAPYVDLSLAKNQAFLERWFSQAGDQPLAGTALEIKTRLEAQRLDTRLPPAPRATHPPRF